MSLESNDVTNCKGWSGPKTHFVNVLRIFGFIAMNSEVKYTLEIIDSFKNI